jgi:hypothetical protein
MAQPKTTLPIRRRLRQFKMAFGSAFLISLMPACVSSNIDFDDVQVTRHNLVFSGIDSTNRNLAPQATSMALEERYEQLNGDEVVELPTRAFSFAKVKTSLPNAVSTSLKIHDVRIDADAKTRDLSFIRRVTLTMLDTQKDDEPSRELFDQKNEPSRREAPQETIAIPLRDSVTVDPRQLHLLTFELSLWVTLRELPEDDWTVAVTLNLDGTVNVDYP